MTSAFSIGDTEIHFVGGSERHTTDAEKVVMGFRDRPTADPQISKFSYGSRQGAAIRFLAQLSNETIIIFNM